MMSDPDLEGNLLALGQSIRTTIETLISYSAESEAAREELRAIEAQLRRSHALSARTDFLISSIRDCFAITLGDFVHLDEDAAVAVTDEQVADALEIFRSSGGLNNPAAAMRKALETFVLTSP